MLWNYFVLKGLKLTETIIETLNIVNAPNFPEQPQDYNRLLALYMDDLDPVAVTSGIRS